MARPEKTISKEDRERVSMLAGYGLTQEQIASIVGMERHTLAKLCGKELEVGKANAIAFVVGKLFTNIKKGDPASIFFYLKTQAGWRERDQVIQEQPRNLVFLDDPAEIRVIQ